MDKSLRKGLSSLCMTEQSHGNSDVLARKNTLVVFIREVPHLCEDGGRELGTAKDFHSRLTGDHTNLLGVCLGEYLVDEGYLLRRGDEFRHGRRRRASLEFAR